jgi:hypothetical protein
MGWKLLRVHELSVGQIREPAESSILMPFLGLLVDKVGNSDIVDPRVRPWRDSEKW